MIKKIKNNIRLDFVIVAVLIIAVFWLAWISVVKLESGNNFDQDVNEFVALVDVARQKALVGEKIDGEIPFAYGVSYFQDEQMFRICADFDGDLVCGENEELDYSLSVKDKFDVGGFKNVNFIRYRTIDKVCVAELCDGEGEQKIVAFRESNSGLEKEIFIDFNNGKLNIK